MDEQLRIVVAGMVAGVPWQGGAVWAVLNWVHGCQALGHDVRLVEQVDALTAERTAYLDRVAAHSDLRGRAALVTPDGQAHGMAFADVLAFCSTADVLINLAGTLRIPELAGAAQRRAYVDLDPGFTQVWHDQGIDVGLAGHTHHVTVGLHVGGPAWQLPTCGVDWIPTLPPVALDRWTPSGPIRHDAWTTVGHWRGYGAAEHDGVALGQRAHSWRALFDLPGRTNVALLPALAVHPGEHDDLAALRTHGWALLDPAEVAATPDAYRAFVCGSRGELGVAKAGYVASNSGWFSDRSACYLAAGRPVVAQDTGWSEHLPVGDGLFAYADVEEAAAHLDGIRRDYLRHRKAAGALAAQFLDARAVVGKVLEAVAQQPSAERGHGVIARIEEAIAVDPKHAIDLAEDVLRCDPDDAAAQRAQRRAVARLGKDAAEATKDLGNQAFERGHFALAHERFAQARDLAPRQPWRHVWLARVENKLWRYDDAAATAQQAVALDAGLPAAWFELVDARRGLADLAGAASALAAAIDCDQINAAQLGRAIRLARELQLDGCLLRAAQRLVLVEPDDDGAAATLAGALWRNGEEDAARSVLSSATGPAAARVAAQLHLEADEPHHAWKAVQASVIDDARFLVAIGHALRRSGRIDAAIAAFTRAQQADPDDAVARQALANAVGERTVLTGAWAATGAGHAPVAPQAVAPQAGRILHVVSRSFPHTLTGYTVRTHYTLKAQRANGLDARAVTEYGYPWTDGTAPRASREVVDLVPYYRLQDPQDRRLALDRRLDCGLEALLGLIGRLRPAALHAASDYRNATVALEAGRIAGLPVIYEVRGFWEESRVAQQGPGAADRECYRWHRDRELACMAQADLVVTIAEVMREELVTRGIARDKIAVVPNAVDPAVFHPQPGGSTVRAELGISDEQFVVGYISSMSHYEGISTLIRAAALLRHQVQGLRVLLVGDGDVRHELEAEAKELGLEDTVIFTGRVPHARVRDYYQALDVFVVPRANQRVSQMVSPLKPFEAMAVGLPLVVSDVQALSEIIEEGRTGLTFRPDDPADLRRVLHDLAGDPAKRASVGAQAADWVAANRTWAANAARYRELYERLGAA